MNALPKNPHPGQLTIGVMTMNLRFGLARDKGNCWEKRQPMVSKILERYSSDFIGFQEVNHFQAEFLAHTLTTHGHIGWHNKQVSWWQSNMIFFHPSWTCLGYRHHFLSHTPDIPSKLKGSKWPRQCVMGWFQKEGREVLVVNTHFDFDSKVQEKSVDLIMDFLTRFPRGLPVIITGDFNAQPDSLAHARFTTNGFREVFEGKEIATFHEFTGKDTGPHIDWILYRGGLIPNHSRVITDSFSNRFPSDHFPVRSVFLWENQ